MNTSISNRSIEPAWKSYLTVAAFALPAIAAAVFSAVYLLPKLEELCRQAGINYPAGVRSIMNIVRFAGQNGLILFLIPCALVGFLEWRSYGWPRYRRASLGIISFVVNTAVLVFLTALFTTAMITAPSLMQPR